MESVLNESVRAAAWACLVTFELSRLRNAADNVINAEIKHPKIAPKTALLWRKEFDALRLESASAHHPERVPSILEAEKIMSYTEALSQITDDPALSKRFESWLSEFKALVGTDRRFSFDSF
jgi:hypothetical protein